jgi:hypothetical protein
MNIMELADTYAALYKIETGHQTIRAALAAAIDALEKEHVQRLLRIEKEVDALVAENERLRGALAKDIEEWGSYASEYLHKKHDLQAAIDTTRTKREPKT